MKIFTKLTKKIKEMESDKIVDKDLQEIWDEWEEAVDEFVPGLLKREKLFLCLVLEKMYYDIDDPCIDNFRLAEVGNAKQCKEYEKQMKDGCCGFYDEAIQSPITHKSYLYGCNYGH